MAIFLKISKIYEDQICVRYAFDSGIENCSDVGVVEINKENGSCSIISDMPGDIENELAGYAYRAILKHWLKLEFPDKTCWAS